MQVGGSEEKRCYFFWYFGLGGGPRETYLCTPGRGPKFSSPIHIEARSGSLPEVGCHAYCDCELAREQLSFRFTEICREGAEPLRSNVDLTDDGN
jgi:hypothetical protein